MLFAMFILLQVVDVVLTYLILKGGGKELNPVMRKLMEAIGTLPAMLLFKTGMVVLVGLTLTSEPLALIALIVLYLAVVINNAKQLYKMEK